LPASCAVLLLPQLLWRRHQRCCCAWRRHRHRVDSRWGKSFWWPAGLRPSSPWELFVSYICCCCFGRRRLRLPCVCVLHRCPLAPAIAPMAPLGTGTIALPSMKGWSAESRCGGATAVPFISTLPHPRRPPLPPPSCPDRSMLLQRMCCAAASAGFLIED